MRIYVVILSIVTILCLAGCSKQSDSAGKQRYVPESAQAITSSPEWKQDFTTKAGIQCYVRTVPADVRSQLSKDFENPDHEYMQEPSVESEPAYFLVMIRNGSIVKDLQPEESGEIMGYILKRDKGFNDALKNMPR